MCGSSTTATTASAPVTSCLGYSMTPSAVRITGCNGTGAQQRDVGRDRTVRPRSDRTLCFTARTSDVALTACGHGRPEQSWNRHPWISTTWKRTAWRFATTGHRCLFQDDRDLPHGPDATNETSPRLTLADCGDTARPELSWRQWGGRPAPARAVGSTTFNRTARSRM
ncbi:ricin-type beta-trefoil lectin domain protein [Streptomyces sp. NPDC049906]|uniref:ricin-type beta-trefoil lectin domain protein n=1 Tax=Streptomyces sp. NPDC049906 TaxID=3155656 RepID=UPI00341EA33B